MNENEIYKRIKQALAQASYNQRTLEMHLQMIKYADKLKTVTAREFCEGVGLGQSFRTEFNKMRNITERLKAAGLDTSKIQENPMTDSEQTTTTQEAMREAVISMAIESWRFARVFDRLLLKLDAGEQNRYKSQFSWFIKKVEEALEQAELQIVNVEEEPFDPGIAATPLNIEEFDEKDNLMVDQMLEPIITGKEGLVKTGTVTLRKV